MKKFLALILAGIMFVTLLSCSQPQEEVFDMDCSGEEVKAGFDGLELKVLSSFYSGNNNTDSENILGYPIGTGLSDLASERIREVEEKYDCSVNLEYKNWSDFTGSFAGGIAGGKSPCDFCFVTSFDIYSWAKAGYLAGIKNELGDIIDYTDSEKWGAPNLLECVFYKDDLYGLLPAAWPDLIYSSFGYPLVANMDLIAASGGDDPRELYEQGVWNWTTFNEQLEKCTVIEGSETTVYGLTSHAPYFAEMILGSNGIALARIDGKVSLRCGFFEPEFLAAAEEVRHVIYGPLAYTFDKISEPDPNVVVDKFCAEEACYSFFPTKFVFGVWGSVAQAIDNYAVLRTPVGPDVDADHVMGIFDGMTYTIAFPTSVINHNAEAAAYVANEIFEPLPGYETFEDVKTYMAHNNFFDKRDAEAFLDVLANCAYNHFYSAGGAVRNISANVGRTETPASELLETHENEVNDFFANAVGDMLQAYKVLFPEIEIVE